MEKFLERGDQVAIIDSEQNMRTYAELHADVNSVACSLRDEYGFGAGDGLMICSPNHPDFFTAAHAAVKLGGFVTTVNSDYSAEDIAAQATDSNCHTIVTHPSILAKVKEGAAMSPGEEHIFVFDVPTHGRPFNSLKGSGKTCVSVTVDTANDTVFLPYSSGTTGKPKGTMLTHENLIANCLQFQYSEARFFRPQGEIVMSPLPMFHVYAFIASLNLTLLHGGSLVTMPKFDFPKFLQLMQQYKCTRTHLVPPIIQALAVHPVVDNFDLTSLKAILSAAAPLGPELEAVCAARFAGQGTIVKQGYGMSELSPVATLTPDDGLKPGTGTSGPAVPGMEMRITDIETGAELGAGEEGELWCRGPNVMKGYINNPQATAETIVDGWLRTGDVGVVDEDGYLTITDRLKELIKYKGLQVPPASLEAILITHPAVADVAVIGLEVGADGEVPRAYVQPADENAGEEVKAEIVDFVASKVVHYMQLRGGVVFVDAIPKSAAGKILRKDLRKRQRDGEFD
jgi:acyl-CoA synthetase (AMP-forming)/AMP-acid ligase II